MAFRKAGEIVFWGIYSISVTERINTSEQLSLNPYLYRCDMLWMIFRALIQPEANVIYNAILRLTPRKPSLAALKDARL